MKEVYVCTVGERGEGYSVIEVYHDKTLALKWLSDQRADLDSDNPSPIEQVTPKYVCFEVSCDIYAVHTWTVQ